MIMNNNNKFLSIIALFITVFSVSLLTSLTSDDKPDDNSIEPISIAVIEDNETKVYSNFKLLQNIDIPSIPEDGYPAFTIERNIMTNDVANQTIKSLFGDIITNETSILSESSRYVYEFDDSVYMIEFDGTITYNNKEEVVYYDIAKIDKSTTLFNKTELEEVTLEIVKNLSYGEFSDYILSDCYSWKKYNLTGEYVKYYVFQYKKQQIEGVGLHGCPFGGISISISPDGTLFSLYFYNPDISPENITSLVTYSNALEKVDNNFQYYSKGRVSGYNDLTLHKVEIAYGAVDSTIRIGWKFYFNSDSDQDAEYTLFVW